MLTFPKSKVDAFVHRNRALRWGQAFHQYMKLDKCVQDKDFCDKLYYVEDKIAKAMAASRIDHTT